MEKIRKFWERNVDHIVDSVWEVVFVIAKGIIYAAIFAVVALLVFPVCRAEGRHIVIADRPMSDGVVEVNVEDVPLDVLIKGLWEKDTSLSRGVMVVGDSDVPLVSIRYVGSLRDLDTAMETLIDGVGWERRRTLRGVDILGPKGSFAPKLPVRATAYPSPTRPAPRTPSGTASPLAGSGAGSSASGS